MSNDNVKWVPTSDNVIEKVTIEKVTMKEPGKADHVYWQVRQGFWLSERFFYEHQAKECAIKRRDTKTITEIIDF